MKKIMKLIAAGCLSSTLLLTGCIDETFPTNAATEDQVTSSNQAAAAMLWAMHAQLNTPATTVGTYHFDYGYGSMMHIRDVQTNDLAVQYSGYDHYWPWEENVYQGKGYAYGQIIWNYYWKCILSCNKLLGAFDLETASDQVKGYIAAAHAYRAMFYLDLARMYEYLPTYGATDPTEDGGNDVTGYTVPIVTEETSEEQSYNNPRVPRAEMAAFILSDLQVAEQNISYLLPESSHCMPHLDAIYGLYARYYMWLGQNVDDTENLEAYRNAQDYARKAIDAASVKPMTQEECLSTSKGFNDISCWMWGSQVVKENDVAQTGIINWVSWMCPETTFGYAGQSAGPVSRIDARLYSQADDNDFRKRMWKAPQGTALDGKTDFLSSSSGLYFGDRVPEYGGVKFRPGEGNPDDVNLATATAYPLMRVEEMYLIEAEAAAHQNAAQGKQLLETFMNSYRIASDANGYTYTCSATAKNDVIEEIILQKRIELWGEGLTFFDVKRLNMGVDRTYEGSIFYAETRFNTNGNRPAWMNYCIVQTEENNNRAVVGWNNPDPTGSYPLN